MEERLSEVLDNLLGMLLLEGSYEIEEDEAGFLVSIDTKDAGRLIGARGESLEGLQLIVNQIMSRGMKDAGHEEFKRVILDVSGWRKQKEEELKSRAADLGKQVLSSGEDLELEPMPPWQRRVVHMVVQEIGGLSSESIGEGRDRHIVIKVKTEEQNVETPKS